MTDVVTRCHYGCNTGVRRSASSSQPDSRRNQMSEWHEFRAPTLGIAMFGYGKNFMQDITVSCILPSVDTASDFEIPIRNLHISM